MTATRTKSTLSPARQQLLRLFQELNFGRIENLDVRQGEPVLDPSPQVIREVKFGGENGPRPERHAHDFLLKGQVVELLDQLDRLQDGTIRLLEVKHGLPFRMLVAEAA
jgi:hypothetical protein